MSFCAKCGNQMESQDKFCSKCGTPVDPNMQAPVQGQPAQQPNTQGQAAPQPQYPPYGVNVIDSPDPVFRIQCEYCYCTFEYRLKDLGHRAWYPHGFVYCPRCRKPLRHNNQYMVNMQGQYQQPTQPYGQQYAQQPIQQPVQQPIPQAPVQQPVQQPVPQVPVQQPIQQSTPVDTTATNPYAPTDNQN